MVKLTVHAMLRCSSTDSLFRGSKRPLPPPDWTAPDPREEGVPRSFKAIPKRGGRVMRVAHRPDGADVLVPSAFFDKGAKP
jgi:hypothetical protein